jgi:hypothetical protein
VVRAFPSSRDVNSSSPALLRFRCVHSLFRISKFILLLEHAQPVPILLDFSFFGISSNIS